MSPKDKVTLGYLTGESEQRYLFYPTPLTSRSLAQSLSAFLCLHSKGLAFISTSLTIRISYQCKFNLDRSSVDY